MRLLQRFAEARGWPAGLGALAILLTLPALGVGLQFDDHLLYRGLSSTPELPTALARAFVFMDGNPAHTQAQMDAGFFPWWALPEGRVAFFRPLSALTHWLDLRLWPAQPVWWHAHSLLWFGLAAAVTAALYRELLAAPAAGLAGLLYVLDDAHGYAAGWLSNRNILLAVVFGGLALLAHHRWRGRRQRWGAWLAPLSFALSLLSAEAALAGLGYFLAYALYLDPAPRRRRWLTLLPYLGVAGLWLGLYRLGGYGGWGTSYIDLTREPGQYALAVLERAPVLLAAQLAYPPAEFYPFVTALWGRAGWWLAASLLTGWVVTRWRTSPAARFWLLGMGLALLLASASLPANRLLFFAGWGAMGWLAQVLVEQPGLPRGWRAAAVGVHLGLAPLLLPIMAFSPLVLGDLAPALLSAPLAATAETVNVVSAPSAFHAQYLGVIRPAHGLSAPAGVRYLGAGLTALTLTRSDARTLIAEPEGGFITGFDAVFRGAGHPLALGEVVRLTGVRIEILALTADGRPARVAFRFEAPLEAGRQQWLAWQAGRFVPFSVPAIGATVRVPAPQPFAP